ncbi:MAG: hypothetical protein IKX57_07985 [Oscillospiraceae bacterium]|nr:hypothetical protein [Oscillospiraceae bacterium]MBR5723556.1 hypothetical protein [Oscillospiraceae bacterium]
MNPLYQYPAEANLLKNGKRGSEDYRDAWKKLAEVTGKQALRSQDKKLQKLHICKTVLLVLSIVLAALYVMVEILSQVLPAANAGGMKNMHVLFAGVIGVPALLCCAVREYVKDGILRHYLRDYEPVCEQYGVETLRKVGEVIRGEHRTAMGNYVCLRCRRGCRYDQTRHGQDGMFCPVCGGDTLVGRITGSLFDICCNYQAELDALESRNLSAENGSVYMGPAGETGK